MDAARNSALEEATTDSATTETTGGRQRILQEARALFRRNGYVNVSMQEIADAVHLTKAAVYYHFGDKERLFAAVFIEEMTELSARIREIIGDSESLHARLERVARDLLESGHSEFGQLLSDYDRYVSDEQRKVIRERVPHHYAAIRPALEEAVAADQIRSEDSSTSPSASILRWSSGRFGANGTGRSRAAPASVARAIADMTLWGIAT